MKHTIYMCVRCGACCRWAGDVNVTDDEVRACAEFLHYTLDEFTSVYCVLADSRRNLVFIDNADGACIFLNAEGRCAIYPVRPVQCRNFPNKWNFPGFRTRCRVAELHYELKKFAGPSRAGDLYARYAAGR